MIIHVFQAGLGFLDTIRGIIGFASSIVMLLMIAAIAGIVYKHFYAGGIEWPDDEESETNEGVSQGDSDDEWKYY